MKSQYLMKLLFTFIFISSLQACAAEAIDSSSAGSCEDCQTGQSNSSNQSATESQKSANELLLQACSGKKTSGKASFYGKGDGFHGKRTASGELLKASGLTAAHRTLPFGTRVKVKMVSTGKQVLVKITDHGPRIKDRMIDLNYAAAKAIGLDEKMGVAFVEMQVCD